MTISSGLDYYRRIAVVYLTPLQSPLDFWYEPPAVNRRAVLDKLGEYYMPFARKADYPGPYDGRGIPMLNYRGNIGLQYNPIAIAQYALGNYNLFLRTGDPSRREKFLKTADWLVRNLERNAAGLAVWNHHFDWVYRVPLKAPWYSGLAQGQGISVLVRAHLETGDTCYLGAAKRAFETFLTTVNEGGVTYVDEVGNTWFEEYITSPPTHILNGFIWASWGVIDYYLATSDLGAKKLFAQAMATLACNLQHYDVGFWSLYDQSGTRMKMLASPFYHSLHIVQLKVLHWLTGNEVFASLADLWESYLRSRSKWTRALVHKAVFKLLYY
jgi:hypothetical protein